MSLGWDPTTHYQEIETAEKYDRIRFAGWSGRAFDRLEKSVILRAFADAPRNTTILDLPSGTGRIAEALLEAGFARVHGVDIAPAMLAVAHRKLARFGERYTSEVGDVFEMAKQRSNEFELGLVARVLMHFPLPQQIEFLGCAATLVRRRVVFTQSLSTPYHRARREVKRWFGHDAPAAYPITTSELRQLVAGAGLKLVRTYRPMPLITEEVIVVADKS